MLIRVHAHTWGNGDRDTLLASIFYNAYSVETIESLMDDSIAGGLATLVVYLLHS